MTPQEFLKDIKDIDLDYVEINIVDEIQLRIYVQSQANIERWLKTLRQEYGIGGVVITLGHNVDHHETGKATRCFRLDVLLTEVKEVAP